MLLPDYVSSNIFLNAFYFFKCVLFLCGYFIFFAGNTEWLKYFLFYKGIEFCTKEKNDYAYIHPDKQKHKGCKASVCI